MKNLLIIILLTWAFGNAQAQNTIDTITIGVSGNCSMCKANIERAAKAKGVKSAVWDIKTHQLTVIYDSTIVEAQTIYTRISDTGYDSDVMVGNDAAYNRLAACCQYTRKRK